MSSNVIAIDGPAASGKSSAAKGLAKRLGILYINTGSLYRAVAWKAQKNGIPFQDEAAVSKMLESTEVIYAIPENGGNPDIRIDGTFPGEALRAPEIAAGASAVAALPPVRAWALGIQRAAAEKTMVVMEGRDIGTAVFPDAKYKFFLTASPRVRAERRLAQEGEALDGATVESVAAEIAERDKRDSERAVAPLRQAPDAIFVDSSEMTLDQVLDLLEKYISKTPEVSMTYRVPYADTDKMGVVYYANYLIYFEMCRSELLRSLGYSYSKMEEDGFAMPVLEAVCRYKASAHFEDLLTITASVTEVKGVRMQISCTVKCGDKLLAEGYTWHACVSMKNGRPVPMPEKLIELCK